MPHSGEFQQPLVSPPRMIAVPLLASPVVFIAPARGYILVADGTVTSLEVIRLGTAVNVG